MKKIVLKNFEKKIKKERKNILKKMQIRLNFINIYVYFKVLCDFVL